MSKNKHWKMRGLEIIHEDRDLIIINKEPGLLTMSFHRDQDATAERLLTEYLKKGQARSRARAYVVHRLDRETSGLLIFAKSEEIQQKLKDNWKSVEKRYTAIIHGKLDQKAGILSSYLWEDQDQFVQSTDDATKGKWSQTQYWVKAENEKFTELDIKLLTGRKNQIRVQFSEAGHPVVGDKKYGKKGDRAERLALHARELSFAHPFNGKQLQFTAPIPTAIKRLMD